LLNGENARVERLLPTHLPTLCLGLPRLRSSRLFSAVKQLRHFWRTHRTEMFQVYFLESAYFGIPLARASGIRQIYRVQNNWGYWLTPKHRLWHRLLRPLTTGYFTNAPGGAQTLQQSGIPPERILLHENGIDLARFPKPTQVDFNKDFVTIGCVANLRPVKNIDGLMRLAATLKSTMPWLRWTVAGDGPQRAELSLLHKELELHDTFRLMGTVADVPGYLNTVDAIVVPSHSEGLSNALLEAMAAGRPVLGTDVGANQAVLAETGVITAFDSFATVLEDWRRNPNIPRHLGHAARERVQAAYSLVASARKYEAILKERLCRGLLPSLVKELFETTEEFV
ncbi:MAG: glycosyltransferase, partial [Gemmataceae bacterium]